MIIPDRSVCIKFYGLCCTAGMIGIMSKADDSEHICQLWLLKLFFKASNNVQYSN